MMIAKRLSDRFWNTIDLVREWIVDTGASRHLVNKSEIVDPDNRVRKIANPSYVSSANGIIALDEELEVCIPSLAEVVACNTKEATANALSLGRLILDHGFRFIWEAGEHPLLFAPDGREVTMFLSNYVPMIRHVGALEHAMANLETASTNTGGDVDTASIGSAATELPDLEEVISDSDEEVCKPTTKLSLLDQPKLGSHLLTHKPYNPQCEICVAVKAKSIS